MSLIEILSTPPNGKKVYRVNFDLRGRWDHFIYTTRVPNLAQLVMTGFYGLWTTNYHTPMLGLFCCLLSGICL